MSNTRQILVMFGERFPVMPEGMELKLFSGPSGYTAEVFKTGASEPFWSAEASRAWRVLRKVEEHFGLNSPETKE